MVRSLSSDTTEEVVEEAGDDKSWEDRAVRRAREHEAQMAEDQRLADEFNKMQRELIAEIKEVEVKIRDIERLDRQFAEEDSKGHGFKFDFLNNISDYTIKWLIALGGYIIIFFSIGETNNLVVTMLSGGAEEEEEEEDEGDEEARRLKATDPNNPFKERNNTMDLQGLSQVTTNNEHSSVFKTAKSYLF